MTVEYFTYQSVNAPGTKRWIAYISTPDVIGYWPIHFSAPSEHHALEKAKAHYQSCAEKREQAIANREEMRRLAKERAAERKAAEL